MTRHLPLLAAALAFAAGLAGNKACAGDLLAGKAKVEATCQVCHGLDGRATVAMTANLSGQQKEYIIAQLKAYRRGKRQHEQMKIIARMLSDDDIENVAEWYSRIKITIELPN